MQSTSIHADSARGAAAGCTGLLVARARAIAVTGEDTWSPIRYSGAIWDEQLRWRFPRLRKELGCGMESGHASASGSDEPTIAQRKHSPAKLRSIRLGRLRISYAVDGAMTLWPDRFFPSIPSEHWAAHADELDAAGQVVMSAGGVLVEDGSRVLLIDTGLGSFDGEHHFGHMRCGTLPDSLSALGVHPDRVDTVAYTHLHVDHVGWTIDPWSRGLMFPNATHLMSEAEWRPYLDGTATTGAPSAAILQALRPRVRCFTDRAEVFPNVTTLITPGHSPGHTSYVIQAGEWRLIVFGDVFHMPCQLAHPKWGSAPDIGIDLATAARERLLEELRQPGTLGFGFHFADLAFGRLAASAVGWAWEPVASGEIVVGTSDDTS